jgi:hypothetical protein
MLNELIANTRRNHALEHATVQLLIAKLGPDLRLVGRASQNGFFIYGNLPPEAVKDCANEALRRLQAGEGYWAVTSLCGTNLLTSGILASLASSLFLRPGNNRNMQNAMMAGVVAVTLAQPLGRLIQRYITTSPDLEGTEIVSIETKPSGRMHHITTRRVSEALAPSPAIA